MSSGSVAAPPVDMTFRGATVDVFAAAARRRRGAATLGFVLLAVLCGALHALSGTEAPIAPLALLAAGGIVAGLWLRPGAVLGVIFVGALFIEMLPGHFTDATTERVPLFWNLNTAVRVYAGAQIEAAPVSGLEFLLAIAGLASLLKAVYFRRVSVRGGALFVPLLAYVAFVLFGWGHGMATGGDFKISLQEVRAQIYLLLAYLVAVNVVTNRRRTLVLLWSVVACTGLKGLQLTFRRYVTLAGQPIPDQGVGTHEDAFFFLVFVALLMALTLCRTMPRMRVAQWALLPTVVIAFLACNRRAGIAAMMIMGAFMLLSAFRALPDRRAMIARTAVLFAAIWTVYYPAFKNNTGMVGLPARAVKSHFDPDPRDASSNAYRDAENACLMATVRLSPLFGYGYGKRMLHAVPIADISYTYEWWDILPHNQILWVWMRVGSLGFLAFWLMVAAALVRCCLVLRDLEGRAATTTAGDEAWRRERMVFTLLAQACVVMLILFGLLDLQLSNYRNMLFTGAMLGAVSGPLFAPVRGTYPLTDAAGGKAAQG